MKLQIEKTHPRLHIDPKRLQNLLDQAIRSVPALGELPGNDVPPDAPLEVTFLTSTDMAVAHERAMGDPTPTDVLTFDLRVPGDPWIAPTPWAEILIDVDTAIDYARDYDCSVAEELFRYLVHGLLHLAGYDDQTAHDFETMKEIQETCLKELLAIPGLPEDLSHAIFLSGGSHE